MHLPAISKYRLFYNSLQAFPARSFLIPPFSCHQHTLDRSQDFLVLRMQLLGQFLETLKQFKNTSCLRMKFNKRIKRSKSFVSTVVCHMYKMCLSYSFSVKESAHHRESERHSIHLNGLGGRACSGGRQSKSWQEGNLVLVESRKYQGHLRGTRPPPRPQKILKISSERQCSASNPTLDFSQ